MSIEGLKYMIDLRKAQESFKEYLKDNDIEGGNRPTI